MANRHMKDVDHHQLLDANKSYNEMLPHMGQNDYHLKNPQTTNAGEGVARREPSCTVGANVNWNSTEVP